MRFSSKFPHCVCLCAAVLAGAAILNSASTARAVPTSFAQFSEASPGGNLFQLNGGTPETDFGTSTGSGLGASIPVNFTFLTVNGVLPPQLQGVQSAHLTMTSSTKQPVQLGFSGTIGAQVFDGTGAFSNSIAITRDSAFNSKTNLLTVSFTNSTLLGIIGSAAPQMSADTATGGVTINYTSDFLTFPNGEHNFSLTFSSWTSFVEQVAIPGLSVLGQDPNLFFRSATAAGAGTFGGNATYVPEPGTFVLLGSGALAIAWMARRRRR